MSVMTIPVRRCGTLPEVAVALRVLRPGSRTTVVAHLSDGDYRFDVALGSEAAVVRVHATLREARAAGGTWWTSRTLRVRGGPSSDLGYQLSGQVVAEVVALRRRFARLLRESRPSRAVPGQAGNGSAGHNGAAPVKSTRNHRHMPPS
jgi:hypothetical protein